MVERTAKIGAGGRLVIPAEIRHAVHLEPGDVVILVAEPDGLRVLTPQQAVARAQALVAQYVEPRRSLADELIAERREERNA